MGAGAEIVVPHVALFIKYSTDPSCQTQPMFVEGLALWITILEVVSKSRISNFLSL